MRKAAAKLFGLAIAVSAIFVSVNAAESSALVKYKITDENSIDKSLTGVDGDPDKGRALSINRKKGNCLACHVMPIPEQQFHGNIGPELHGVGERYSKGEIRLRIVNPKVVNSDTIMPAFYRNSGFTRTHKKFRGKTILSAQEVEDILSYVAMIGENYKVRSGDTLSQIAQSNKASLRNILVLNPALKGNPDKLNVGQEIVMPAGSN